jgi:hypothetical protein
MRTNSNDEEAASDLLAAPYVVPRGLKGKAWMNWRRENPPPYLLPENRRGTVCGVCGGPLGPVTRICFACHRGELEEART